MSSERCYSYDNSDNTGYRQLTFALLLENVIYNIKILKYNIKKWPYVMSIVDITQALSVSALAVKKRCLCTNTAEN